MGEVADGSTWQWGSPSMASPEMMVAGGWGKESSMEWGEQRMGWGARAHNSEHSFAMLWDGTGLLMREEGLTVARRRDDAGFGGAKAGATS